MLKCAPRLAAPPTKQGTHGRAWLVDLSTWHRINEKPHATICHWVVEAPWAHPFWHSYFLGAVHLRPVPGMQTAQILLPGATHEVMLYALNPEHTPKLDGPSHFLMPGNFHGQWIAESDDAAKAFIEATAQLVIDGKLNPDTDARSQWIRRFSASNMKVPTALADATGIGVVGDSLVVVGTGKTAVDAITTIAAGPKPPAKDMH